MLPRRIGALALLLALLGGPAGAADLRIQLNPALAALNERDPARAERTLDDLLAIVEQGTAGAALPPKTRGMLDPAEQRLIDANPLIREAYRIDPKAALEQLRLIVAAGGG